MNYTESGQVTKVSSYQEFPGLYGKWSLPSLIKNKPLQYFIKMVNAMYIVSDFKIWITSLTSNLCVIQNENGVFTCSLLSTQAIYNMNDSEDVHVAYSVPRLFITWMILRMYF